MKNVSAKKMIALLLVLCLSLMSGLSVQPLKAASEEAANSAIHLEYESEQGSFEVENHDKRSFSRKPSFTPILIGLLAAGAIGAVLFLVVLRSYDINGGWTLNYKWSDMNSFGVMELTFSGSRSSGDFTDLLGNQGYYRVNGKKIEFNYHGGARYTGTITDKNTMSGNMSAGDLIGVWNAVRAGSR